MGYETLEGDILHGEQVTLARGKQSSPEFLSSHSAPDDLVQFKGFDSEADQDAWVARQIRKNLNEDELYPNDVLVVHPEPSRAKSRTAAIRADLIDSGVRPYLAGLDGHADTFWPDDESVVFLLGPSRQRQ